MEASFADLLESGKLPQVNYSAEYTFNKSSAICLCAPEEAPSCQRWQRRGVGRGCGVAGGPFKGAGGGPGKWGAIRRQSPQLKNKSAAPMTRGGLTPRQRLERHTTAKSRQPEAERADEKRLLVPWWNQTGTQSLIDCFYLYIMNRWGEIRAVLFTHS